MIDSPFFCPLLLHYTAICLTLIIELLDKYYLENLKYSFEDINRIVLLLLC